MRIQDSSRSLLISKLFVLTALVVMLPGHTPAQETGQADEDEDTLTVTGTRIQRTDAIANSPIVRLDEAAFERSGVINVEDILRQLPQFVAGISPGVNLGNPGAATLNLRGLGSTRTLVLIDGKRSAPYDHQSIVDVN